MLAMREMLDAMGAPVPVAVFLSAVFLRRFFNIFNQLLFQKYHLVKLSSLN